MRRTSVTTRMWMSSEPQRSGLLAIWKRDNFWAEPSGADWMIDNLAELPPLVLTHRSSANLQS